MSEERYLGDGVYASLDSNGMIKLRCACPSEPDVIFLDNGVMKNLLTFAQKIGMIDKGSS